MRAPTSTVLRDAEVEQVRRDHHDRIVELQALPATAMRVLPGIQLADGVPTPIAHGLGRRPRWVRESCPRGGSTVGSVIEVRDGSYNPDRYVVLQADGWGATITVDVVVL